MRVRAMDGTDEGRLESHELATHNTENTIKAASAWDAGEVNRMGDLETLTFAADSGAAGTVASHDELAMCERKPREKRKHGVEL